jgi:hypothetical protein
MRRLDAAVVTAVVLLLGVGDHVDGVQHEQQHTNTKVYYTEIFHCQPVNNNVV